jgi:DNA-binding winged helix-turn-helix (wHTH) protein
VSALRRKLEAAGPRLIHTVRGVGYVLRPVAVPREDQQPAYSLELRSA